MAFLVFGDGVATTGNYLLYSEQFDNAAWTKHTGVTVSANAVTAPDGSVTADAITYDGSGVAGDYRLLQPAQAPYDVLPLGVSVTVSIWLKAPTATTVRLATNIGGVVTCAVTSLWQRFSVTAVGTGAGLTELLIVSPVGSNATFTLHAWGAQVNPGSAALGYITTVSSAAGGVSLMNDYVDTPASRFSGWTPMTRPYGDSVPVLGSGQLVMVRYRTDYGASFSLEGIPVKAQADGVNYAALADRLVAWLLQGGTVSVQTGDANASIYPTCGLWPGSTPTLQLSDKRNLLYTLSLQLINLAGSPVRMDCVYQ